MRSRVWFKTRYGIDITIRNIYLHANDVMNEYFPSVVVFPFLYRISDLAITDYVEAWPKATYFNLAWEQVHYKAHLKMKAPGDEFTRQRVTHHAWGDFYKNYLIESGVPTEHVFVNGNPVYQLYKEPYNKYFKDEPNWPIKMTWILRRNGYSFQRITNGLFFQTKNSNAL